MVKGVTRQVILVDSPDRRRFEKAIFILKDGSRENAEDLLLEAQTLAARSMGAEPRPRKPPRWLCALAGAAFTGALWLFLTLVRGTVP